MGIAYGRQPFSRRKPNGRNGTRGDLLRRLDRLVERERGKTISPSSSYKPAADDLFRELRCTAERALATVRRAYLPLLW